MKRHKNASIYSFKFIYIFLYLLGVLYFLLYTFIFFIGFQISNNYQVTKSQALPPQNGGRGNTPEHGIYYKFFGLPGEFLFITRKTRYMLKYNGRMLAT